MTGLIQEIQRDALDPKVPTDALLRRVKLAAAKLNLENLETWVEQELNGYSRELPSYRKLFGQPAGWNPYNGWIPIYSADPEFMGIISQAPISQSIASLRDLLDNHSGGSLHFPVAPSLVATLNEIMNARTARVVIQIGRSSIAGILDAVRNLVLDWSIEMERKGVLGHGMTFEPGERKQAQSAMTTFNIGNIGSFIGNMGAEASSGDIVVSSSAIGQITEIANKIKAALPELVREGADGEQLRGALDSIGAELEKPKPESGALKAFFVDARAAVAGAAGNMMAEGALALIANAMALLGG